MGRCAIAMILSFARDATRPDALCPRCQFLFGYFWSAGAAFNYLIDAIASHPLSSWRFSFRSLRPASVKINLYLRLCVPCLFEIWICPSVYYFNKACLKISPRGELCYLAVLKLRNVGVKCKYSCFIAIVRKKEILKYSKGCWHFGGSSKCLL